MTDARERFLTALREAVASGTLDKLTLGRPVGSDPTVRNLFVRPVTLKAGLRLAFLWRHQTRDVTKNAANDEGLVELERLIGGAFHSAHLFTPARSLQLERGETGAWKLRTIEKERTPAGRGHDRDKARPIPADAPWLRALGVTNDQGRPREGMGAKLRQIEKFAELLQGLMGEAGLDGPVSVCDMGSGKGYLTFAVSALLGERGRVRGIEAREELADLCNRVARDEGFAPRLEFSAGSIAGAEVRDVDVLIALHACDTATDDALAKGIAAGARLLVTAPCCQKELRAQLVPPPVLADALRHGIFQERQAEFVTDALRAQLLEWAGYRTKVFEFISTEHTAKNTLIAAVRDDGLLRRRDDIARAIRTFAAFYGIRHQSLATQLKFTLIHDN